MSQQTPISQFDNVLDSINKQKPTRVSWVTILALALIPILIVCLVLNVIPSEKQPPFEALQTLFNYP